MPDSVGYCRDIGINLSAWLEAKLLDAVVLGGSFQLNRWSVTGDLVRKAGLPYYVSFAASDYYGPPRAGPGDTRANRVRTTDIRLAVACAAVHSDMLKWTPSNDPHEAARSILWQGGTRWPVATEPRFGVYYAA